jgi:hypothetical protein
MLTAEQLKKLVFERGYGVIADTYSEDSEVWREFVPASRIYTADQDTMLDYPFGSRKIAPIGLGEMRPIQEGERIPQDILAEGPARQCKLHEVGTALTITQDMMMVRDAESRIVSQIIDWSRRVSQSASRFRNDYIAGMFQQGTLAAGSTKYFDNSYTGTPDANRGFIYDGKPWFAASGNAHPLQGYSGAVGDTGVNLVPSSALNSANFQGGYTQFSVTNARDERFQPITNRPAVLLAGAAMRQTVAAITESDLLPGSANNDANAFKGLVRPIIWDRLTDDSDAWWLLGEDPGLDVYDSGVPEIELIPDPIRRVMTFTATIRFGACVRDWRGAACANKATS